MTVFCEGTTVILVSLLYVERGWPSRPLVPEILRGLGVQAVPGTLPKRRLRADSDPASFADLKE